MQDFINKKILLGITGGIAAYKSTYLVRELMKAGAKVRVVMTESAKQFVTPLTLQALTGEPVRSELFDSDAEAAMGHIELARWADYLVIAPATANIIAKIAHGMADDLLTTLYLATDIPVFIAPAMNRLMWQHEATQFNCKRLHERGVRFIGPEEGEQACGEVGLGRMSEAKHILNALRLVDVKSVLKGKRVLITAGPTYESIDPVRYLTNRSSGKMGYALAEAARTAGAIVTLISGPSQVIPPLGVKLIKVKTAFEMHEAVMKELKEGDIFIGAAAVADYHFSEPSSEKIKKTGEDLLTLQFQTNKDILAEVSASGKPSLCIGFAAETQDVIENARKKLKAKQLDLVIANQVGRNKGFDKDDNELLIISPKGLKELDKDHKLRLAAKIINYIEEGVF